MSANVCTFTERFWLQLTSFSSVHSNSPHPWPCLLQRVAPAGAQRQVQRGGAGPAGQAVGLARAAALPRARPRPAGSARRGSSRAAGGRRGGDVGGDAPRSAATPLLLLCVLGAWVQCCFFYRNHRNLRTNHPALSAGGLGRALAVAASTAPPVAANQQTALRLACNCFLHAPLLRWLQPQVGGACRQQLCVPACQVLPI